MPGLTSSSYGSGDQRWLGSTHGLRAARSGYGLASAFSDVVTDDGYIPSGTAVDASTENDLKPWTGAAGEQLGFIVNDLTVPGDDDGFTTAVLRHGTINIDHLPQTLPEAPEGNDGHFIFVTMGGA